jgi:DNA adenine methylase
VRPLLKYPGGKYYLSKWIIQHFPKNYEDLAYTELCGGAANVLINKNPSIREYYNDKDPDLFYLFYHLVNTPSFLKIINNIPYTRELFETYKTNYCLFSSSKGDVMDSIYYFVMMRMSRGGLGKSFAWSERKRGGLPGDVHAWQTLFAELPKIRDRMSNVILSCDDIIYKIKELDSSDTLHYVDPPYMHNTRISKSIYRYEMDEEYHFNLGNMLNTLRGKIMISGYSSPLYTDLFKDWRLITRETVAHSGQQKKKTSRIECLWVNY